MLRALATLAALAVISFGIAAIVTAAIIPDPRPAMPALADLAVSSCPAAGVTSGTSCPIRPEATCPMKRLERQGMSSRCPYAAAAAAAGCPAFSARPERAPGHDRPHARSEMIAAVTPEETAEARNPLDLS